MCVEKIKVIHWGKMKILAFHIFFKSVLSASALVLLDLQRQLHISIWNNMLWQESLKVHFIYERSSWGR